MHYSSYVSAWSSIDVVALSNIWWVWLLMGVAGDLNGCGKCSYSCTFDSSFDGFLSLFAHHAPPPSTPWLYMEWQRTQLCMQRILPSISLKEAVSCGTMWMGGVEVVVSRRRLLPSFLFHCVLLIYVKKSTLETNVCKPFSVVLKAIKNARTLNLLFLLWYTANGGMWPNPVWLGRSWWSMLAIFWA